MDDHIGITRDVLDNRLAIRRGDGPRREYTPTPASVDRIVGWTLRHYISWINTGHGWRASCRRERNR